MRIDPTREHHRSSRVTGRRISAARHREPKPPLDEQPASSAPSDLGDAVTAVFGPATTTRLAVLPKLCDTISDQRFTESGVRVHGLLL
jgi:hypothetical protein